MNYVDDVWGCELMEAPDAENQPLINEIVYTIDNTTKTRAIFEINKGIGKIDGIDVNSKIPQELRRVKFENMIYIADGTKRYPGLFPCTSKRRFHLCHLSKGRRRCHEAGRTDACRRKS